MDVLSEALARMLRRQWDLDQRLARIEAHLNLAPVEASVVAPPAPQAVETPVAPPPLPMEPPPIEAAGAKEDRLPDGRGSVSEAARVGASAAATTETNIGLMWINRVGVITLILFTTFVFKWAVDNQWIGPGGRVILGVLAGMIALAIADVLWKRDQKVFAQGLTAIGIGVLYLASYAAYGFYELIPQSLAFLFMVATTALAIMLALRYDSVAMAVMALTGGFLTPLFLSTGEDHPWFFFSYLLLLDVGAMALGRRKQWKALEILSAGFTFVLYGAWLASHFKTGKELVATLFALIFYALYSQALWPPLVLIAQVCAAGAMVIVWHRSPEQFLTLSLVLAIAGLANADYRRIRFSSSVAFAAYWGFYAAWVSDMYTQPPVGTVFFGITCGFVAFFAWAPWRTIYRREAARFEDLTILALNGAAYFGASYVLLNPDYHAWMGLFAVVIAGVHLLLAAQLRKMDSSADPRSLVLSLGVTFTLLTLAIPIQFTAYRITMAWSLEAMALSWIGLRTGRKMAGYAALLITAIVWIRLFSIDSWLYANDDKTYALFANPRFLTFLIAGVASLLAAYWNRQSPTALIQYFGGHAILLWGLSLEDIGWAVRSSTAGNEVSVITVSLSVLFTVYAMILIAVGVSTRTAINRIAGLALIAFVVLKLYLFDVWQLGRIYRIFAFGALGGLLLATSYLYSRFRKSIEAFWKDEQTPS